MNDWGRALLVDAITYISRFTEDRPIMTTPSPFAGQEFASRRHIEDIMRRGDGWWDFLQSYFDQRALNRRGHEDSGGLHEVVSKVRDCLAPNSENLLRVDDDAKAINLYPGRREFFDRAIVDLGRPGREAERARRMLNRYVPEGPGPDAMGQAWADWWKANADYLFFGEAGGYRWYLDPLAKARCVPTGQLRGPARASR